MRFCSLLAVATCLLMSRNAASAAEAPLFSGPLVDSLTSHWETKSALGMIALSPHAQRIAAFEPATGVRIFDQRGQQLQLLTVPQIPIPTGKFPTAHLNVSARFSWSSDSKTLLLSTPTGAFLWREKAAKGAAPVNFDQPYELIWQSMAQSAFLSPDGSRIAFSVPTAETPARDPGYTLYVQRVGDNRPLWKLFVGPLPMVAGQWPTGPQGVIWTAFARPVTTAFAQDGSPTFHPEAPVMVTAWSALTGRHSFQFEIPNADGGTLFFSGEGHNLVGFVYSATAKTPSDNGLYRWDLSEGAPHQIVLHGGADASFQTYPNDVAVPFPLLAIARGTRGSLYRADTGTFQGYVSYPIPASVPAPAPVTDEWVAFAPDGDYLLLAATHPLPTISSAPNGSVNLSTVFYLYHLRSL